MNSYVGEIPWEDIINDTDWYSYINMVYKQAKIKHFKKYEQYETFKSVIQRCSAKNEIKNYKNYPYTKDLYRVCFQKDIKEQIKNNIFEVFCPYADSADFREYEFLMTFVIPFVIFTDKELEEIDDIAIAGVVECFDQEHGADD